MCDVIRAVRTYIDRILKPKDKASEIVGMKALLLDRETVRLCDRGCAARSLVQPPLCVRACRRPSSAWRTACTKSWRRRVRPRLARACCVRSVVPAMAL
jgi:hypothetical protein